jgi:hypothetical protein
VLPPVSAVLKIGAIISIAFNLVIVGAPIKSLVGIYIENTSISEGLALAGLVVPKVLISYKY